MRKLIILGGAGIGPGAADSAETKGAGGKIARFAAKMASTKPDLPDRIKYKPEIEKLHSKIGQLVVERDF